jgi:hypothetical protein
MASQSWGQQIAAITTPGTSYASWTTAKSMLTSATANAAAAGFITLPPGFFQPNGHIEIDIEAAIGWASGNTMTFQVNVGAVIAFTSDALKVTTTGGTAIGALLKIILSVASIGNGTLATLAGNGYAVGRMIVPPGATAGADYTAGSGSAVLKAAPAAGTGFDSTVSNTLDFLLAMGTSSASNTFQLRQYSVRSWGNSAP